MPVILKDFVRVYSNGRITIPSSMRATLKLEDGDQLYVETNEKGQIIITPEKEGGPRD
jgi:AbrB family looped-hinge helix DNA binding protein